MKLGKWEIPEGVLGGTLEEVRGGTMDGILRGIPEGVPGRFPGGVRRGIPEEALEDFRRIFLEKSLKNDGFPERISGENPRRFSCRNLGWNIWWNSFGWDSDHTEVTPGNKTKGILERNSEGTPIGIPRRIQDWTPGVISEKNTVDIPEGSPVGILERLQELM